MAKKPAGRASLASGLREARKSGGWTQAELAERAGMAERTVRGLEAGGGGVAAFQRALAALGVVLRYRNAAAVPIAEVIRTLRTRRGLSQKELARVAGVSRPTIGSLERSGAGQLAPLERVLVALGAGAHLAPAGQAKAFYSTAGNSSVGQAWETPSELLEVLYSVFGRFDLDPCSPTKKGPVKARVRFTAEDDGLDLPWKGRVFVNPPYGRGLGAWVSKARCEYEVGGAGLVVLLIPARTETSYWHRNVAGKASVWFIEGRLKFGGGKQSAPFPSALAVFGATPEEKERLDRSAVGWRAT